MVDAALEVKFGANLSEDHAPIALLIRRDKRPVSKMDLPPAVSDSLSSFA